MGLSAWYRWPRWCGLLLGYVMFHTLNTALNLALSASLEDYDGDHGQALLELATVAGYGSRDNVAAGNVDSGNYALMGYMPVAGDWQPVLLTFTMDAPQASLSGVAIHYPLMVNQPQADLELLVANAVWPAARTW